MKDEKHDEQMSMPNAGVLKDKYRTKGGALDQTFPSAWLLGAAILVVVVLTVLSGWKIVNLEQERAK